jgi:zinc transporter ZupT
MSDTSPSTLPANQPRLSAGAVGLALIPLLLLGVVLAYLVVTGGGLTDLAGPPVEQISIERITLPEPNRIEMTVINDGPQPVTIAQLFIDEAYWVFEIEPSATIPRLGRATIQIPYPWVLEEAHEIVLVTELGGTFVGEIPVAVLTPQPSGSLFLRFGLVGLYVGIVPVALGMLWYPFMRRLSRRAMNFILSLTIGLLVYLAVGTWLDAMEFAAELPAFWQGVPLVFFIGLLTLGSLLAIGSTGRGKERSGLALAYLIALGIGLHNLGEGLAIGAAFAVGEAALGTFLVLGFTLHNITEGIGIAAPLLPSLRAQDPGATGGAPASKASPVDPQGRSTPRAATFVGLTLLAGSPAILGAWIGGFAFSPLLANLFLGIGVGAIWQVIVEVGDLLRAYARSRAEGVVNWINLGGFALGVLIMYFTAFLVSF